MLAESSPARGDMISGGGVSCFRWRAAAGFTPSQSHRGGGIYKLFRQLICDAAKLCKSRSPPRVGKRNILGASVAGSFCPEMRRWKAEGGRSSEFDARLGFDAGAKRVLDQCHLGHEVGRLDQLGFGVAAGDDDMQAVRLRI